MTMYGLPLAPHEIDAMPQAERVLATIDQAESDTEMACEELHIPTLNELDEYKGATIDLWHSLNELLDVLRHDSQDALDIQIGLAATCLKRNKDLS